MKFRDGLIYFCVALAFCCVGCSVLNTRNNQKVEVAINRVEKLGKKPPALEDFDIVLKGFSRPNSRGIDMAYEYVLDGTCTVRLETHPETLAHYRESIDRIVENRESGSEKSTDRNGQIRIISCTFRNVEGVSIYHRNW